MGHGSWDKVIVRSGALTAALVMAACTSTAPSRLSSRQVTAIEGKSVARQRGSPTHFSLVSSSSTLASAVNPFGAGANAAKAQKAGDMIVEQDGLIDPVTVIGPALLADLEKKYGMKDTAMELPARTAGSTKSSAGADFVLWVEVPVWTTMYLPMNLTHYGVMLVARAKLVDSVTAKPLREARCIIRPRSQPEAPTFTELMENNGVRLRVEVDYATQACIQALRQSLVGQ
jgi:hypothetical protein